MSLHVSVPKETVGLHRKASETLSCLSTLTLYFIHPVSYYELVKLTFRVYGQKIAFRCSPTVFLETNKLTSIYFFNSTLLRT